MAGAGRSQATAWRVAYIEEIAFGIVVVIVTFVSLIIGELVPKRVALTHAESLAMFVAPFMRVFARAMAPAVWLLRTAVNLVLRILPVSSAPQAAVTEDDVRALVAEGTHAGVFLASERRLLEGVMALADRKVGSIMVPRQDVIWLDLDEPLETLWQQAKESGHARFLVARGKLDNLLGMITLADLSEVVHRGTSRSGARSAAAAAHSGFDVRAAVAGSVSEIEHPPRHRHRRVRRDRRHHDADRHSESHRRGVAGTWQSRTTRGRAARRWFMARRRPSVDRGTTAESGPTRMVGRDYHTVAGFVLARLGRIPKAGDTLTWRDLKIEIMDMDGVRIDKVLLTARTLNG